jgi:tape measure domain-containing protein
VNGFDFEISADPSRANAAIDSVESHLNKMRAAAQSVSLKMREAANQTAGWNLAKRATSEMNEQLQRQQSILKSIHGPMDTHRADLNALLQLYRMNKVSASEYAAQLTRINGELARAQGKSAPQAGLGFGTFGRVAAAAGVTVGAGQVGELANEYQNLQNRLRYLAGGDQQKVNDLFRDMQQIAKSTRSDLSATTESFVRMSLATKDMGLSTSEATTLTERINKAIKLSGATSQEAAAGMIQLSQGLASGALRGDELRSVMEQLPAVADVIAKSMGVTRGQLREMGKDGKITAEVVVEAFRKAGPELDKAFGTTLPTLADGLTQFKNEMLVVSAELVDKTGAAYAFGGALHAVGTAAKTVTGLFELMEEAFGETATKMTVAAVALGVAIRAGLGPVAVVVAAMEAGAYIGTKLAQVWDGGAAESIKLSQAIIKQSEAIIAASKEVGVHHKAIHDVVVANRTLTEQLVASTREVVDGTTSWQTFTDVLTSGASAIGELTAKIDLGRNALVEMNKPYVDAIDNVKKYEAAVIALKTQWGDIAAKKGVSITTFLSAGDVAAVRAYQDAQQDAADLGGRYGKIVSEIHKQERERSRGLEDLRGALAAGEITQAQFNEAVKRFSPDAKRAAGDARRLADEYKRLAAEIFGPGKRPGKQHMEGEWYKAEIEREVNAEIEAEERAAKAKIEQEERIFRVSMELQEQKARAHQEWVDAVAKATDDAAARRLKQQEEDQAARAAAIAQIWAPVNTALVDMFTEGEFALDDFVKSMEKALAQLAIKILMTSLLMKAFGMSNAGYINALGGDAALGKAMGFATGGSFTVGGVGGSDSQMVAFRATPGERVTVTSQGEQARGASGTTQMGAPTVINNVFDRRALLSGLRTGDGRDIILNIIRDNPGAVRAALQRSR